MKDNKKEIKQTKPRKKTTLGRVMNRLFDESFWSTFNKSVMSRLSLNRIGFPKVDIVETNKEIIITANIPGLSLRDILIEVNESVILISGQVNKQHITSNKEKKFYRYERESGSFFRRLFLPIKIDEANTKSEMEKGVLKIFLPKIQKEAKKEMAISRITKRPLLN